MINQRRETSIGSNNILTVNLQNDDSLIGILNIFQESD